MAKPHIDILAILMLLCGAANMLHFRHTALFIVGVSRGNETHGRKGAHFGRCIDNTRRHPRPIDFVRASRARGRRSHYFAHAQTERRIEILAEAGNLHEAGALVHGDGLGLTAASFEHELPSAQPMRMLFERG